MVMKNKMFLPFQFKIGGWILIVAGIILTIIYASTNLRISMPVLAVYSSYMEAKLFTIFTTNFAEELIMLLYVCGFLLVTFSRCRNEQESDNELRLIAIFKALIYNTIFLAFSILFIYGNGFMLVLVLNLFSTFIFYVLLFAWLKYKRKRAQELS